MNKELCFNIENVSLYLEKVLVDYMDIPIFFLCKGEDHHYIVLCTDINELKYIVAKLSLLDVYNLLHGNIPMRDVILRQTKYWEIDSGEQVDSDIVVKKNIDTINVDLLPEMNACFKILTEEMRVFVQEFDCEFFSAKYFSESNQKIDLNEQVTSFSIDILLRDIEQFTELVDFKIGKVDFSRSILYDECMNFIKTKEITFLSSTQSRQLGKDDGFKLEAHVKEILLAA